ncbi:MAG TPA: glycosyltransferase 87 family protein [Solirubrobacteraceae bacterium]|jgi:hypothetical protein|nr:glycosyltransferase 87 family protein [Solirubrobacteraceae bacterium]
MSTHGPLSLRAPSSRLAALGLPALAPRRLAYLALLVAAPLLPHLNSNAFFFPAVSNGWVCLPFCALLLLALIDLRAPGRRLHLDLLALVALSASLACWRAWWEWPMLLAFGLLLYLAARMLAIARTPDAEAASRRGEAAHTAGAASAPEAPRGALLPRSWLLLGIAVLAVVHVSWALSGTAQVDVGESGVQGAQRIADGHPLYGRVASEARVDRHLDTYGPVDYEAYLPFVGLAGGGYDAARLTTLFFDLLTALLLFVLGRRVRGPTCGVVLAYCWLAFPFTLYCDALGLNDPILAAALVGTLLAAASPLRRGAAAALAVWVKFSPLALLPLLATHGAGGSARRRVLRFGLAFALASALVFVPALLHGSLATFASRSFGFQTGRPPFVSIWSVLIQRFSASAPSIVTASRVAHGVLAALTGALAIALPRLRRRTDVVGLAAACAALMIALELCLSYYAFSYVLWFAPLVLVALILDAFPPERAVGAPDASRSNGSGDFGDARDLGRRAGVVRGLRALGGQTA